MFLERGDDERGHAEETVTAHVGLRQTMDGSTTSAENVLPAAGRRSKRRGGIADVTAFEACGSRGRHCGIYSTTCDTESDVWLPELTSPF